MHERWYLGTIDLLSEIPDSERDFFLGKSIRRRYGKNVTIFSPGDQGALIYYVLSGCVKIYNLSECGKEIIYWFCHPKDMFGLAEISGGEMRSVFAETVKETEVLSISKLHFEEIIRRKPDIAFLLLKIMGSRIRQSHETIKDLIVCDVRSRLAQLLIKLGQICSASGEKTVILDRKLTHLEMANMIGATRTTVTEILNEFKKDGLITCQGGKITILNNVALARYLEQTREYPNQ